jgi:hypothetical protein
LSEPGSTVVEFGIDGWAFEFFTMESHHDLTIEFRDKTALYLKIDPVTTCKRFLEKRTRDGVEVIHAWPSISLEA